LNTFPLNTFYFDTFLHQLPRTESANSKDERSNRNTFMPFLRLPTELRLKIWSLSMPGPRDVQVLVRRSQKDPPEMNRSVIKALSSVPTILRVNHEARTEGLKVYKACLKEKDSDQRSIYTNPTVDTLFVRLPKCFPILLGTPSFTRLETWT
jgi:hypothetical protein